MSTTSPQTKAPAPAMDFQPIADYGLLADCNSAALVSRDGSIDWLCMPRYDSPSVFARILDPDAGHWSIRPSTEYETTRRYLPGTLVVETTFTTATGTVRLVDALAFAEGQRRHDARLRRAAQLLRLVEGVEGTVELELELAPRGEYGLVRPLFRQVEGGGRTFGGPNQIAVSAGVPTEVDESTMRARFAVSAGEQVGFALHWAAVESPAPMPYPPERVAAADRGHRRGLALVGGRARHLRGPAPRARPPELARAQGPDLPAHRRDRRRPDDCSLPETVGGERNWDYRYAWIRDASLTLEALYIGACSDEAEDFVSFMTSSAGGRAGEGSLQIMYGIGGEHDLSERDAAAPARLARLGAGARRQRRLGPDAARRLRRAAQRAAPLPRAPGRAAPRDPAVRCRPGRHRGATLDGEGRRACGRCAASRGTISHRRSCAGRRWTARSSSRPHSASTQRSRRGRPSATASARPCYPGLEREARRVRPELRLRRARRGAAAHADRSASCRRPTRA